MVTIAWWGLIIVFVIGGLIGLMIAALCNAAHNADDEQNG